MEVKRQVEIYCDTCRSRGRRGHAETFRLTSRGWAGTSHKDLRHVALDQNNTPWGLEESANGLPSKHPSRDLPATVACDTCSNTVLIRDDKLQQLMRTVVGVADQRGITKRTVSIPVTLVRRLLESDRPVDGLRLWFDAFGAS